VRATRPFREERPSRILEEEQMRKFVLGMLAAMLLVAVPASAQELRGSIQGVVKDSSGGVLPGVTVEAKSPALVGTQTAVTDSDGVYRFPALAPGKYAI